MRNMERHRNTLESLDDYYEQARDDLFREWDTQDTQQDGVGTFQNPGNHDQEE